MNEKIKDAILTFLEKKKLVTENTYNELLEESTKLKESREILNKSLLDCKKKYN